LKKKTQELEKFKFVLDYKIKELRKMIAPRQTEITALRKETREMDAKLKNYNTMNSNLGFMVEDLRNRQEAMQDSIKQNRLKRMYNDILISKMKTDVYWTVQHIDDFEALQKVVN
jgi:cilia- and flagella-associated protein 57